MIKEVAMDKVRVLLVGGERGKFPDKFAKAVNIVGQVDVTAPGIPQGVAKDAEVIVVLTRWTRLNEKVTPLAKSRGIPAIRAGSFNLALVRLAEHTEFTGRVTTNGKTHHEEQETEEKEEGHPQKPELSKEDARAQFDQLCEVVQGWWDLGDTITKEDLVKNAYELNGIVESVVDSLIPDLVSSGILKQVKEGKWILVRTADGERKDVSEKEIAKRVDKEKYYLRHITGLPEGPYPNRWQLGLAMSRYVEFEKSAGVPFTKSYYGLLAKKAILAKIAEERGGELWIKHDPHVKLTPRETAPEPPKKEAPPKRRETKSVSLNRIDTILPAPKLPESRSRFLSEEDARKNLGNPTIPPNVDREQLKRFKFSVLDSRWDEMARKSIEVRLTRAGYEPHAIRRELFTPDEWDALAWERLATMPIETVIFAFKRGYLDEECICVECRRTFIFTKGEREWHHQKFGAIMTPRRCPECRKKRKEGNQEDDDLRSPLYS